MKTSKSSSRVPIQSLMSLEKIASLGFILFCLTLALLSPAPIDRSPEAPPLEHTVAPWIFWPIQTLLLVLPAWLAGLFIPIVIVLILVSLPWLNKVSLTSKLKLGTFLVSVVCICLFLLMLLSLGLNRVIL